MNYNNIENIKILGFLAAHIIILVIIADFIMSQSDKNINKKLFNINYNTEKPLNK